MEEMIIAFVILALVAAVMITIGVCQIRKKEPVGFYSGEKPPKKEQISDVKAWNHKHGIMWLAYGIVMIASYIVAAFIKSEVVAGIILLVVIVGALPIMIVYHERLKRKYYIDVVKK
ncbi:MAG: hypothetical protein IJW18_08430 [Lachnospiraceae bacterium]|nr:hypothetical protein [Lachnospiraceae bacterium]